MTDLYCADHHDPRTLSPCDFFLVGVPQRQILLLLPYLVSNLQDLRHPIQEAVQFIAWEMLLRVLTELEYRLDICRANNEHHLLFVLKFLVLYFKTC